MWKPLVITLVILFTSPGISIATHHIDLVDKAMLRYFLEKQYVPQAGLLRAATIAYPDNITCYIANDNVLAARALAILGSPLASNVLSILNNNFSGGWNGKIDILLGRDIPDKFYSSYNELVGEVNGYRIVYEKLNYSGTITDWYNYADLIVYYALDRLLSGSRPEAEQAFLNLTNMWDGYGFRDKAYNGIYAVYKCALFIYLYRALEYAGSTIIHDYKYIYDKCLEIISKAHNPIYGGIHTDYKVEKGEIIIQGDMNTETTSIVVLALYSNYPEIIGKKARPKQPPNQFMHGYETAETTLPYIIALTITLIALGLSYKIFRKLRLNVSHYNHPKIFTPPFTNQVIESHNISFASSRSKTDNLTPVVFILHRKLRLFILSSPNH